MRYRYYVWAEHLSNLHPTLWRKKVEKRESGVYELSKDGKTWVKCVSRDLTHKDFAEGSTKRISRYEAEKLCPNLFKRVKRRFYVIKGKMRKDEHTCLWMKKAPFTDCDHYFFVRGMPKFKHRMFGCTHKQFVTTNCRRIGQRLARMYFPEVFRKPLP